MGLDHKGGHRRRVVVAGLTWVAAGLLIPSSGRAQDAPQPDRGRAPAADLATRYRLLERYTTNDEKAGPGVVGTYKVAFKETESVSQENPRGAPERRQHTQQVVMTERPAEISTLDDRVVTTLVRRYEAVRVTPDTWTKAMGPRPLNGLTVLYRPQAEGAPRVLSLTPDRGLLDADFTFTTTTVFVPSLALVLPEVPVHVGDIWAVPRDGADALVAAQVSEGGLRCKLLRVQPGPGAADGRVATLDVSGRVVTTDGDTTVHAELQFAFTEGQPDKDSIVEARGAITKLSLAQVSAGFIKREDRPEDRAKRTRKRELVLERKLEAGGPPLEVLATLPEPTEGNSWLTYVDPEARFHFRFPQEFRTPDGIVQKQDNFTLSRLLPESADVIRLRFTPKGQVKPDDFFKGFFDDFRQKLGAEVLKGATRSLPESEWPGVRVTRAEAAVSFTGQGPRRLHLFGYVLQFARNASLSAGATTFQPSPTGFRNEVEAILKTFRLGGPEAKK
jgi:hypothetical protein